MQRLQTAITRSVLLAVVLFAPVHALAAGREGGLRPPFLANWGQVDARVAFYAAAHDGTLFVTRDGQLVYSLPPRTAGAGWTVTETLIEGQPRPVAQDPSATAVSYFAGPDPALWRSNAPVYRQVGLGQVWPGIAVTLRAQRQGVEKIFTLSPGASVERIQIRVGGASGLSVRADGALVGTTGLGEIAFTAPVAYQERDGARRPVQVAYRLDGQQYGFAVGAYDPRLPLVIDPRLQSTYLGGSSNDSGSSIATHPTTGDVYVAGSTTSTNFPGTTGGAQPAYAGNRDAFVARLSSDLTTLFRATYLGGTGDDQAFALAVHPSSGAVYTAGSTTSSDFPGTAGGAQPNPAGAGDAFVSRLSSDLATLQQSTYLGGTLTDSAAGLAIHQTTGDVYIGGSSSTPVACGGSTGLVARFNAALTQTLGLAGVGPGRVKAIRIHPTSGLPYVAGADDSFPADAAAASTDRFFACPTRGFVKRLDAALVVTATLQFNADLILGGFASANALAIDPASGDIVTAGASDAASLSPVLGAPQATCLGICAFVARLNAGLTAIIQATFLGNNDAAELGASSVAIHPTNGNVYVAGTTRDPNFPRTKGPSFPLPGPANGLQPALAGDVDAFITRLTGSLAAIYQSTYLGGIGADIGAALAIHANGNVYVAGTTTPLVFPLADFPGTAGGAQPTAGGASDAFAASLDPTLAQVDPPAGPDLTITKSHEGDFVKGIAGSLYAIMVSNIGTAPTVGTVTVVDTLPAGLIANSLGLPGDGWTCVLATLTCTRADALAPGQTYPPLNFLVTASSFGPSAVINTATVSGGGDVNPGNNTANDPTNLVSFFVDVDPDNPFIPYIEALFASGLTGGCQIVPVPRYCPESPVTREEMAVFIERGLRGVGFVPPPPIGFFLDVPLTNPAAGFIEQFYFDGISAGCNATPPLFCPIENVTRAEMAIFLLRAKHGAGFVPPPAAGIFADLPAGNPFAPWAEQLFGEGITTGCSTSPLMYCPNDFVTRQEMAVFLVRVFNLPFLP